MERENRRLLVGATGCVPLEREPDAAVDVASAPVREAGVGRLAQEIVPEGELAVVGLLHELGERFPPLGVTGLRHLVGENLPHQVEPEHRSHDGRVAEQHPVRRSERVDPRGEERLDRFRKVARVVCAAAATSSRKKSGLPAARKAMSSTASSESACSAATASANSVALSTSSGASSSRWPRPPRSTRESPDGLVVTSRNHGRGV